jgi:hypothetical protein
MMDPTREGGASRLSRSRGSVVFVPDVGYPQMPSSPDEQASVVRKRGGREKRRNGRRTMT